MSGVAHCQSCRQKNNKHRCILERGGNALNSPSQNPGVERSVRKDSPWGHWGWQGIVCAPLTSGHEEVWKRTWHGPYFRHLGLLCPLNVTNLFSSLLSSLLGCYSREDVDAMNCWLYFSAFYPGIIWAGSWAGSITALSLHGYWGRLLSVNLDFVNTGCEIIIFLATRGY